MNAENAIEVNDLKKSFKVYMDKGSQLKERVLFKKRNRYENREVLKGISFEVKKGEAIGLIGHNGCGKSTTLKLLSKIIYPDSGTIEMKGRVSSLIELGAGFHPDMSGRENIYTNASIFGLSKKEIDARVEDIIEFSELEEFIDNPVRTYSSGMYMRLAFAVAINVDADILLVDEILAVGDAGFQTKCFNKMKEIKADGTTIVIVSHAMGQIEQICDRSIWIHEGEIKAEGKPREVDPQYLEYIASERKNVTKKHLDKGNSKKEQEEEKEKKEECDSDTKDKTRWGNNKARITALRMLDEKGCENNTFITGEECVLEIKYNAKKEVENAIVGIGIYTLDDMRVYGTNTRIDNLPTFFLNESGTIQFRIEELPLLSGNYYLDVAIEQDLNTPVDYWRKAVSFNVFSKKEEAGVSQIKHTWLIK
ncbi:MAG: ABC transporter ATP-binding protein [Lachnospiraceae bacterium]|nr:ABC transporter ATP-binding protein [Lachnospiraceae bacterium]